jgi:hypothetical protein
MITQLTFNGIEAKPFLKWAGGKSQLLSQFQELYPPALRAGMIDNPLLVVAQSFLILQETLI